MKKVGKRVGRLGKRRGRWRNTKHTGQEQRALHQVGKEKKGGSWCMGASWVALLLQHIHLHPYPAHPSSSIPILGLFSSLEGRWLKTVLIFPLLFQTWRVKNRDESELKILTGFQKEKRKGKWEKKATKQIWVDVTLTVLWLREISRLGVFGFVFFNHSYYNY